jgi:hypothetical protein
VQREEIFKFTLLKRRENRLARHGKITSGKLTATDRTNPILMTSLIRVGVKLISTFPVI